MSYFVCGFRTDTASFASFREVFSGIVPSHLRKDTLRMEGDPSYFSSYGNNKVIQDIAIRSEGDGSWLIIVGTPLVVMESKQQGQDFLNEFLISPEDSMRYKIDGNFAVLCYDARKVRFIIAADFNNTIPIFYSVTPNGVFFSSHELPLARFLNAEIDPVGFSQSIHLGVTWSTYTRFRGVYKTLPCQISIVDSKNKLHTEPYWRPRNEKVWSGGFEEQLEKWGALLRESVWKFYECSGQKPVISDFTAGEDARLILSQCHALGIPFKAQVTGVADDIEVLVAKRGAQKAGFELMERRQHWITEEELLANAPDISVSSDAYREFFKACTDFETDRVNPLDDYRIVKYGGLPGGEAFRGSYYFRGKAIFPSLKSTLNHKFFTRLKYLLDYYPGLLKYPDNDFLLKVNEIVEDNLDDVKGFPIGTQVDHMLRVFQTCFLGLKYKNPLYLPFATSEMTRSIYCLSPSYKRGGRLTKAYNEILYPELAFIKTQNGVPTIRKTFMRFPLFIPEYMSSLKKITSGAVSRLFKWKQSNKWYYSQDLNVRICKTLLNNPPYSNWFKSSNEMVTGHLYNSDMVNSILENGRTGTCRYVPILQRIISQELACRWVYRE